MQAGWVGMFVGVSDVFDWVLLAYRLPREPSTPRIALWRKLKRFGVAQLLDGLVTLPADARTREQLEWVADEIVVAGGSASVWTARPTAAVQQRDIAAGMAAAITSEYLTVLASVDSAKTWAVVERRREYSRLQREVERIGRRDFFPPPERETARRAVRELGVLVEADA